MVIVEAFECSVQLSFPFGASGRVIFRPCRIPSFISFITKYWSFPSRQAPAWRFRVLRFVICARQIQIRNIAKQCHSERRFPREEPAFCSAGILPALA